MCGKFTQMMSWAELHRHFDLLGKSASDDGETDATRPDANDQEQMVTPMREAFVVTLGASGRRIVASMRWGWRDRRASAPMARPKHMHARAETLDALPTFRASFAARRGIVVARTFNVGEEIGKKVVQHVVTPLDGQLLALAVIWDEVPTMDGEPAPAFVMVTTLPNAPIATVADRMPAILAPEHWALWLGETDAPLDQAKAVLTPYTGQLDMRLQAKTPPRPRGKIHATPLML